MKPTKSRYEYIWIKLGVLEKKFWRVCGCGFRSDTLLAKENLFENISLAKDHFLIMNPFLHDLMEFYTAYSFCKQNCLKTHDNLAPPKNNFHVLFFFKIPPPTPWAHTPHLAEAVGCMLCVYWKSLGILWWDQGWQLLKPSSLIFP